MRLYRGELPWGMLLICQSGDSDYEHPSESEFAEASSLGRVFIKKKSVVFVLTESHVEGDEVRVNLNSRMSDRGSPSFEDKATIYTSTGKIYIGDIPKRMYATIEFVNTNNPTFIIKGYRNDGAIVIDISTGSRYKKCEQSERVKR